MSKNRLIVFSLITLCTATLAGCRGDSENCNDEADISKIQVEVSVTRLEDEIFQCKTKEDVRRLLDKYPDFADRFYFRKKLKSDTTAINAVYDMVKAQGWDSVYTDVKKRFGDFAQIKSEFEEAFKHLKYYYPNFKIPKIYTTISGLGYFSAGNIHVSSDVIIVGLDFYYGKGSRYRPDIKGAPDYVWRRYHPQAIVPTCLEFISNQYNKIDNLDKTVLNEMIAYGKAFQFVRQMMPCLADTVLLGYSSEEIGNLQAPDNKEYVWNHFIEKKILFSTDTKQVKAYVEDRPFIAEINKKCPGRIGQWLGWRIIKKYKQKHPDVKFQDLMANQDAKAIFQASGYKGE
jgi:gliding motility-associated lipoprotein GldB